ncbi:phosphatidylinositol 4-kinase gamma-like [Raphidocelis subcapitata]|uniref:1-phosphatidylinositol 4-kinase n=1 Tax=Raphidocelis subcapitata TaxID=307507 RepID=A0A2V0PP70_9CHLO|nr:phosphatidylinositol 4-kinase gamma-like [Raphidocelis subcapitata]|eukprot:GBF98975.1 phosphatidylinositol 4-kinase gamma-like [Raphidocelis subcapitata]
MALCSARVADAAGPTAAPRAPLPVVHAPSHVRLVLAVPHVAPAPDVVQPAATSPQQQQQEQEEHYETLEVMADEAIKDLKLRMLNRGFRRPPGTGCLVFGDLDEHVRAGLVRASPAPGSDFLHIFAPAAAVESVSVRTLLREFSLSSGAGGSPAGAGAWPLVVAAPRRAAAAAAPAGANAASAAAPPPPPPAEAAATSAVVHLLVHKSARVAWRHMGNDTFELSISSPAETTTAKDLMRKVEDATGLSLRDGQHQLVYGSQVLEATRPLADYGITKGAVLKLLPVQPAAAAPAGDDGADGAAPRDTLPDGSPRLESPLHSLHEHWKRARAGLAEGHAPRLAPAGTGGCYFLLDEEGRPTAVFKPNDEEPLAANNPRGRAAPPPPSPIHLGGAWTFPAPPPPRTTGAAAAGGEAAIAAGAVAPGEGLRRGLRPGEGAVREVAAFVLDHGNFSGVPPTAMVQLEVGRGVAGAGEAPAAKVGSLQTFVAAESDCEERGVSAFSAREVHKIAILDLRLGNTDRNGSNILARRGGADGGWELVPIDHGCCLPDSFEDISFEWSWWPQAELPFDEAARAYIAALDADKDAATLAAHGLPVRPECLRVLRVCTMVLKKGAAAGLTPAQIAGVVSREGPGRSPVERMHALAAARASAEAGGAPEAAREAAYLRHMGALVDELLADDFVLENAGQLLL